MSGRCCTYLVFGVRLKMELKSRGMYGIGCNRITFSCSKT